MIEEVRRRRESVPADGETVSGRPPLVAAPSADRRRVGAHPTQAIGPEELIVEARNHPLGLRFLVDAPPETVAVTFAVHPFIVFRARGLLSNHDSGPQDATKAGFGEEG